MKSATDVEIVNIVAAGDYRREFDLHALVEDLTAVSVQYEPETFPGLQIHDKPDGGVMTIFTSGSYTITGVQTERELEYLFNSVTEKLEELEINIPEDSTPPEIRNIVCKADLARELELSALAIALGTDYTEYEPEQSAFLYYWPSDFDGLITIPASGKAAITGIKTQEEAEQGFKRLQTKIDSLFTE